MIGRKRERNIFLNVIKEKTISQSFWTANERKLRKAKVILAGIAGRDVTIYSFTPLNGNTCIAIVENMAFI